MSTYYIIDSTSTKGGKTPVITFNSTSGVVKHLEEMCKRKFGQSRKDYMFSCSELGFGEDDNAGRAFYEQMEQYFNVGVIRKDSQPVRCNIFEADKSFKGRNEHGD
jgi:hypothetical protein